MIRTLALLIGVMSFVVLLAEGAGVGWLWWQGRLSGEQLRNLQLALRGPSPVVAESLPKDEPKPIEETLPQIREARIARALDLQAREQELGLLKTMTTEAANQLIQERKAFDVMKQTFATELEQLRAQTTDAARDQARAVLLASKPEDAVERLMGLSLEEGALLMRGMPEKSIAKILAVFIGDPQRVERGQKLFEAIERGEPQRTLIDQMQTEAQPAGTTP